MDMNTLLITGSSSGLGRGIVENLDKQKYSPIITYTHNAEGARQAAEYAATTTHTPTTLHLDLGSEDSIDIFCKDILQNHTIIDTIVCNAGIDYYHEAFEDVTDEEWRKVFSIKLFGHVSLIRRLLPLLQKSSNPNIIFISASLAKRPDPLDPAYSSVSAAINTFAHSLVYALKHHSIRTNIICPGPMDTNLSYWKSVKSKNSGIFDALASSNPMGSLTQPADVVAIIQTIIENRMLNGNTFYIDGGSHLRP
jgi:NAD(P)-dependent dehydrogenase (short-subunit alcohol dehydrogenase family)